MNSITKHHGLGNDFLVLERAFAAPVGEPEADLARNLCDRRRGVGADGLLFLGIHPDDPEHLSMVLLNADGSRAEMSGNGIRCLVQAAHRRRSGNIDDLGAATGAVTYHVDTDAGRRDVVVRATDDPDTVMAEVDMGEVVALPEPPRWSELGCDPMRPVAHVSLGNPHSVVAVDDVTQVDLAMLGGIVPQVNLEIVEPGPEDHAITMRVHERGAGITEACGTGACASAWAAARWGLVATREPEILVHMDGGDASVRLHHPTEGRLTLVGPATYVATVTF